MGIRGAWRAPPPPISRGGEAAKKSAFGSTKRTVLAGVVPAEDCERKEEPVDPMERKDTVDPVEEIDAALETDRREAMLA
jgi:hypothetical protein